MGHHFFTNIPHGYTSGGAGYVISKPAVSKIIKDGSKFPSMCRRDGGYEDVEIGRYVTNVLVIALHFRQPFDAFLRASAMLKHVIDIGWTSVCPSVCLSVTRWHCIKTAERIVMISSMSIVNVNSRFVQRIVAKPLMRCVR